MKIELSFPDSLDEHANTRLSCAGLSLLFVFTEKLRRDLVLFKDERRHFFLPLQKEKVFHLEAEYIHDVKKDLSVISAASFRRVAGIYEPQRAVLMGWGSPTLPDSALFSSNCALPNIMTLPEYNNVKVKIHSRKCKNVQTH